MTGFVVLASGTAGRNRPYRCFSFLILILLLILISSGSTRSNRACADGIKIKSMELPTKS
ncbi:hypothetical protein Pla52o_38580 [Novipirellula galeiformis]|uniref:Uncharacterized protein n=1 Tax=Novipirellula galeiformis TaxID=2528004 RepID=A0A5C6CE19_9BACT|nr:hypothetical protein Pla52o_38580 [Novipirellula galeiformis]